MGSSKNQRPSNIWQWLALDNSALDQSDLVEINLTIASEIPGLESLDIETFNITHRATAATQPAGRNQWRITIHPRRNASTQRHFTLFARHNLEYERTTRMNATATHPPRRENRLTRLGLLTEPAGYVDGVNLYEYVGDNPVIRLDPMGHQSTQPATTPGSFSKRFKPIPLPKGKDRIEMPLGEALKLLGLKDPQKVIDAGILKRGCVDLFNYLKPRISILTCFRTPKEADAFQCPVGMTMRMTGIVQGYPRRAGLDINDDGSVVPSSLEIGSRPFNYTIQQPDGTYIYMNEGGGNVIVSDFYPTRPKEDSPDWTTLYCVICAAPEKQ